MKVIMDVSIHRNYFLALQLRYSSSNSWAWRGTLLCSDLSLIRYLKCMPGSSDMQYPNWPWIRTSQLSGMTFSNSLRSFFTPWNDLEAVIQDHTVVNAGLIPQWSDPIVSVRGCFRDMPAERHSFPPTETQNWLNQYYECLSVTWNAMQKSHYIVM